MEHPQNVVPIHLSGLGKNILKEIPVLDNIRYTSVRNHNSGSSYSNLVLVGRGDKTLTTIRQGASKADAMRLCLQGWGDLA